MPQLSTNIVFFTYGLCVMYYMLSAWIFHVKNSMRLFRYLSLLLVVVTLEALKDLFFITSNPQFGQFDWFVLMSVDLIALPFYNVVLIELCRPGWVTGRFIILNVAPFALIPLLLIITHEPVFYFIDLGLTVFYFIVGAVRGSINIRRYNTVMRERFSYDENINLRWLGYIVVAVLVIFLLWTIDCFGANIDLQIVCMTGSLICWILITRFIYKHESVIDELPSSAAPQTITAEELPEAPLPPDSAELLRRKLHALFHEDHIFLNPRLKLSDVAALAGTNRTYVSQFFNRTSSSSFFEYVNTMRVEYACKLLQTSPAPLAEIAEMSGFNSLATFHRVFSKLKGCSPAKFRESVQSAD